MTEYVYQARVRWSDQDPQGHVNNVVYLDYMQEARVDWILSGPHAGMLADGVIVVSHRIEYLAPSLFGGDPVIVRMWVASVGAARFEVQYDIEQGAALVARAGSVCATYDPQTRSVRRLTPDERAWLRGFRGPAREFRELPRAAGNPAGGFRGPLRVRYSEIDPYGHVNNVSYLTYLQEAHIAALAEPRRDMPWGGPGDPTRWIVAAQDIHYRAPMRYQLEPYACQVVIVRVGRTSLSFEVRITDPHVDVTYAIGHQVLVHADAHGRPREIPELLRDRLTPLLAADQGEGTAHPAGSGPLPR